MQTETKHQRAVIYPYCVYYYEFTPLHALVYPSCSAFSTVCVPFLHAFSAIFQIWAILTPKSTKISYYKLHKLVNARRRGIMVSRIKMMHEVVMEWMCTLLVIV